MNFIWRYLKNYKWRVAAAMGLKFLGTILELLIPYVLEHMIDNIAPRQDLKLVLLWGCIMLSLAFVVRFINVTANRKGMRIAADCTYEVRRDLFWSSLNFSGSQVDAIGLPSLTSRMTSDSYNIQNFIRNAQAVGIRAPIMLLGGIFVTMTMDAGLSLILAIMAPIALLIVISISRKGIPMYAKVQNGLDDVVRIMRENITGIRVVKALSKEDYERRRFSEANEVMSKAERTVGGTMALPGPLVTLFLNVGLTLVVIVGAKRVDAGLTKPGVILAFLTYFNMILMAVRGLNRFFTMLSKANASANRIQSIVDKKEDLPQLEENLCKAFPDQALDKGEKPYILFDHVSFRYGDDSLAAAASASHEGDDWFNGEERHKALDDISFSISKGGSLGIIGATGCGKTTIINLLMRFYDCSQGAVFVDGKDVRSYDKDQLHRLFGVVFQNDVIFADSLYENITFGRTVSQAALDQAAADACCTDFLSHYSDGYEHKAAIRGASFSGGQRQRVLIARALVANPEILVLDDSSSALDYRTDAALRKAIREHYSQATTIIIAQRISSIMGLDEIIMLDEGRILGRGTHEQLMETCPQYRDIYMTQMGEEA